VLKNHLFAKRLKAVFEIDQSVLLMENRRVFIKHRILIFLLQTLSRASVA
jgi:hypothetical protein